MGRLLFVVFGIVALASSGSVRAAVIPPADPVAGISQAILADQWWAWILQTPESINPLTNDPTGALAGINNTGPVFFLAGSTGGGFANRNISVPAGTPLFFPLINQVDLELSPSVATSIGASTCQGEPNPYQCALAFIPPQTPSNLVATLNGTPLDPNLNSDFAAYFQQSSALVPVNIPPGNIFGVPSDPGAEFVQNGYYIALEGLAPGTYTLVFGDLAEGFGAIDTINVVPEPASLTLLATALLGFGMIRRRRKTN